ncbi:MAG: HD domain-containing protein [Anaerolineae bacterium]
MAKKKTTKPDWRQAVKATMLKATKKESVRRNGTKSYSFNYRWEHVTAVVTLAKKLAELTGADADVVEAAAWLHDIRKETKQAHPQEGAKFAREFLPKTDFPKKKIKSVAQAIEQHMGLWREKPLKNLEAQVLWDADKLSKMGMTAVFHFTCWQLAGSKPETLDSLLARGKDADWMAKTVNSFHTKPARKAAKKRFKTYWKTWEKLEKELNGQDLL